MLPPFWRNAVQLYPNLCGNTLGTIHAKSYIPRAAFEISIEVFSTFRKTLTGSIKVRTGFVISHVSTDTCLFPKKSNLFNATSLRISGGIQSEFQGDFLLTLLTDRRGRNFFGFKRERERVPFKRYNVKRSTQRVAYIQSLQVLY